MVPPTVELLSDLSRSKAREAQQADHVPCKAMESSNYRTAKGLQNVFHRHILDLQDGAYRARSDVVFVKVSGFARIASVMRPMAD